MHLLSCNTFGVPLFSPSPKERLTVLGKKIEEMKPDVVCLQEVHTYSLLHNLKSNLPSFPYVAYKKSLYGAKGGMVIFSRLPIVHTFFLPLSLFKDRPKETIWQLLSVRTKGVLLVEFDTCYLLSVHLSANISGDWSPNNPYEKTQSFELAQVTQIVKKLKAKKNVIVTGDFNIAKKSSLYSGFIRNTLLNDVFKNDKQPTYREEFLPKGREAQVIDFIFYSKDSFRIIDKKFVFQEKEKIGNKLQYLSDHIGLYATLA